MTAKARLARCKHGHDAMRHTATFLVRMPPEMVALIDDSARLRGVSRSALARAWLFEGIAGDMDGGTVKDFDCMASGGHYGEARTWQQKQ